MKGFQVNNDLGMVSESNTPVKEPSASETIAKEIVSKYVRVVDGAGRYVVYINNKNSGESEWHPVCSCSYGDEADDIEADLRQTMKEAIIEALERK